jgi:hypothetical protein
VHSRNLNVPLFERGYEKDPALVAQHGIYEGTATHSHTLFSGAVREAMIY